MQAFANLRAAPGRAPSIREGFAAAPDVSIAKFPEINI